ncbi:MAG TPA: M12 family metallo-peptidase [Thermoanaerobaculia bacterium]|nr:M12 family metallo-peptidase [Thermoanaerobaculia bacterium]
MTSRTAIRTAISLFFLSLAGAATAAEHHFDREILAPLSKPLKTGVAIRIENVPLTEGQPETLELERFELWTEDAEITVFGANGKVVEKLTPPAATYYRGSIAGQPESLAFVSIHGDRVEGIIYSGDRKFSLGSRRVNAQKREVIVQESSAMDDIPLESEGFTCDLEGAPVLAQNRPRAVSNALGEVEANAAPTGTQRSVINLAVETDYELFVNAGSNTTNVTNYIGNLVAAASTIYNRDLLTEIRIAYLGIQNSSSDPFNVYPGQSGTWNGVTTPLTSMHALLELGDRWHNAPPSTNKRSAVALISGKNYGGGIAWVGTLCSGDLAYQGHWGGAYSFNGGIDPPNDLSVPNPDGTVNYVAPSSNYWPLMQLTHELGHNVGSSHTHCISLSPAQKTQYNVTRNYVDECHAGEGGCFAGSVSVPAEKGSIMSYCHLRSGGGTNTRFTFGQPGQTSEVVRNNMRANMAGKTPSLSAINAPASLNAGATGNASVASVAGLTYAWAISNGTITSSAALAAITFTGTTNPVTLRVTATNTNGCSITDTFTVSIGGGTTLPAPASFAATAISSTSVATSWAAVTGATGYQIWRSGDGTNFTHVGTTGGPTSYNDGTAASGISYLYRVRATNASGVGPFSAVDLATAIIFTDPVITAGVTRPRAVHFNELRAGVNSLRTLAGLGAIALTAPVPGASVSVRKAHLDTLRTGLNAARTALGLGAWPFTDATITATSTRIKSAHISELRAGLQ